MSEEMDDRDRRILDFFKAMFFGNKETRRQLPKKHETVYKHYETVIKMIVEELIDDKINEALEKSEK
jgi:hypothetical protein